jgi:hypothetical protein
VYKNMARKLQSKRLYGAHRQKWVSNIQIDAGDTRCKCGGRVEPPRCELSSCFYEL